MATYTKSGTTANDAFTFTSVGGQPKSGNIYTIDGLAGTDSFRFDEGTSGKYLSSYLSTKFTIQPVNGSGVIVVTGASTGGTSLTFNLNSVEQLIFGDKTVTLSYGPSDLTAPTVSSFSPADAATGVTESADIVVTFSEAIQKGTGTIVIHSGSASGTVIESFDAATNTANLAVSGSTLTINPTSNLGSSTNYFVTFDAGSIKDIAGNSYAGTTTYDFTTGDTLAPTVSTYSPADGATGVVASSNIVVTFSEAIQKGTGTITIHSGSAAGAVVESFDASASARLSISGSTLTIDPTNNLAESTQYFVTFDAGTVKDAAGNGIAAVTTYDFTTSDSIAPTVSTFSPVDAATGVSETSNIVVTFSESIQKGAGTIAIHSGSAAGPVVESYDAATNAANLSISGSTLTIDPSAVLAGNTQYFVTFDAGSIKDLSGNSYSGTTSYDFTTGDTLAPTVTQFSPTDAATGVAVASNIVVTFSEAIQKGTGTIAIHSGSASGTVVESFDAATSSLLSISGSALTIDPAADLTSNTSYFVTFDAGTIKDAAGNGISAVTTYDFTTVDTVAPTVTTFTPASAATGIAVSDNIVLKFSEAVQLGTGTIAIHTGSASGTLVESYNPANSTNLSITGDTLTINPTGNLANSTDYYVTFSDGSIQDLASNHYAGTSAYHFSTVAAAVSASGSSSGAGAAVALAGAAGLGLFAWLLL
jgi:methionine-rich copper-binding protein CopC